MVGIRKGIAGITNGMVVIRCSRLKSQLLLHHIPPRQMIVAVGSVESIHSLAITLECGLVLIHRPEEVLDMPPFTRYTTLTPHSVAPKGISLHT